MDGQPLRYHLRPDGSFLLYSVGEDGKDNGGDATPADSTSMAGKLWWKARDAVWPMPATAEDVKTDFEKMAVQREREEASRSSAAKLGTSPRDKQFTERYGVRGAPSAQTNPSTSAGK
jgi:hypothetical protein